MEFNTRRFKIIIASIFGALLFAGLIYIASILVSTSPKIRYYLDVTFNLTKEHEAYVDGIKYTLPLPRGFAKLHSDSEFSRIYSTKLTVEEILTWYEEKGYRVEDNRVYADDLYYTIEDRGVDDACPKRIIVEIKRYVR